MLLTGFASFSHNSHQAQQMQRALHAQRRLFKRWRRSVQSRVADWMHGPCRATIRRRLHLKGWQSEQQWHVQYETHRYLLLLLRLTLSLTWRFCTVTHLLHVHILFPGLLLAYS